MLKELPIEKVEAKDLPTLVSDPSRCVSFLHLSNTDHVAQIPTYERFEFPTRRVYVS